MAIVAVVAAYGLLYLLFVVSREFAHTYAHWIEGVGGADLPRLTVLVLPAVGIEGGPQWAGAVAALGWLLLAAWPGAALVSCLRGSAVAEGVGLQLLGWLLLLLAAAVVVAAGLWAPFALL